MNYVRLDDWNTLVAILLSHAVHQAGHLGCSVDLYHTRVTWSSHKHVMMYRLKYTFDGVQFDGLIWQLIISIYIPRTINVLVALTCQILAGHFEPLYSNATILFYHKYSMRRLAFRFFSSGINFHNMGLKNVRHSSNAKTVHQCVTCET